MYAEIEHIEMTIRIGKIVCGVCLAISMAGVITLMVFSVVSILEKAREPKRTLIYWYGTKKKIYK